MQAKKLKGSFFLRLTVWGFGVAVSILSFWLLGYVLRDVDRIEGPNLATMLQLAIPAELQSQRTANYNLENDLQKQIASVGEQRRLLMQTVSDSQQMITQLLELQRVATETKQPLSEEQQQAMTENLQIFLETQRNAQELNSKLSSLNDQLIALREGQVELENRINVASEPTLQLYSRQYAAHQWRLAAYKLAILVPLLLACGWLFAKKARSSYATLVYAIGAAVSLRVILVMHDHFPAIFFRYVLIILSLAVCLAVLIRLLRLMAHPNRSSLESQYRESYASLLCPQCDFPIQRGPLKFGSWTRRSLRKHLGAIAASTTAASDEPYTCPACSTSLFQACATCGKIRHSLLPSCEHCGASMETLE